MSYVRMNGDESTKEYMNEISEIPYLEKHCGYEVADYFRKRISSSIELQKQLDEVNQELENTNELYDELENENYDWEHESAKNILFMISAFNSLKEIIAKNKLDDEFKEVMDSLDKQFGISEAEKEKYSVKNVK